MENDEGPPLRETLLSYFSGVLFAIAWWIWIDAHAKSVELKAAGPGFGPFYLVGILGSVAFVMINTVSWKDLMGGEWAFGEEGSQAKIRIWFFLALILGFGAICLSLWLGIEKWLNNSEFPYKYPGVALIVQNMMIFASALLFKFRIPLPSTGETQHLFG